MVTKANRAIEKEQVRLKKLEKQYKYFEGHVKNSEKLSKLTAEEI